MVIQIKSKEHLKTILNEAKDKLVVVDFFATWCGPCRFIAPVMEELSQEHSDIIILKVDVDECEDVAADYEVSSMPTFVFIKNGRVLETFTGANVEKLKATIKKHR